MVGARQALTLRGRRRTLVRSLALAAGLAGAVLAVWSRRAGFGGVDGSVALPAFAAAVALFAVAPLVQATMFWLILRRLGRASGLAETISYWARSFLLRYAPTGAVGYAYRVSERHRVDAPLAALVAATAYEQLLALLAGAAVVVTASLLAHGEPPLLAVGALAAASALVLFLRPRWAAAALRPLLARRGIELSSLLPTRAVAALGALAAAAWIPTGAAVWVLVSALGRDDAPGLFWLVAAYAGAWLAGFLVPFLPAGLGVRDGALAALLAAPFGAAEGAALAVALRLANTLGELVAIGTVELLTRRTRSGDRHAG